MIHQMKQAETNFWANLAKGPVRALDELRTTTEIVRQQVYFHRKWVW